MKQFILNQKKAITGIGAAMLIGVVTLSFQDSPLIHQRPELQIATDDTLPEKNKKESMTMKEYDEMMQDLDKNMQRIGEDLKKIDFSFIGKSVENALKEVDMDMIMKETSLAIKSIDLDRILSDVRSSLKEINSEKINTELSEAMTEAKKELEKAKVEMKEIDKESIRKAMDEARKEIEKARLEISKLDMDKIRSEVDKGIGEAKEELGRTKALFNALEKDGLISRKDGFSIEYKNRELYINGKKQPESVTDKYRSYFSKDHFSITIDKD